MSGPGSGIPDVGPAGGRKAEAPPRSDARLAFALFLAFQGLFLLAASGRSRTTDEHSFHAMTESLAGEGRLSVPQMERAGHFYGRFGKDGRPYCPYGFGQAVLAVPYHVLAGRLLEHAMPGRNAFLAREAATSLLSTTAAAIAIALFFLLARRAGAGAMIAFATAALLGVSTPLAVYAKQAFAEPLLACLAAGAWLALARGLKTRSKVSLAIASALAGWAFATRFVPGSMLAFALAAGFAFERRRWPGWREVLAMALPFVVLASSCLALNLARFGDPLQFGYPDAAEGGKALNAFSTPILHGLWGLLLSPGKGIFLFAPIVIAALAGFRLLFARLPGVAAAVAVFSLATLVFYAGYAQWEGGYCFGPRYLVPLLPGLVLPLACALGERSRPLARIVVFLAVVGVAVQAIGVSTSFLEDQAGTGRYYDARFDYRSDYTLASQARLFGRYASTLPTAGAFQERLGWGFDFWWVFLRKAGLSSGALMAWAAIGAIFLFAGIRGLRAAWPRPPATGSSP